jgi:exosome complex protein LRP1
VKSQEPTALAMSDAPEAPLQNVATNLSNVKKVLSSLHNSLSEDDDGLDLKESAQLNIGLAFALGSLYFVLLNCKGAGQSADSDLPINSELDRIKQYVQRVSKMIKVPEVRKVAVDSEAAARMIKHNLDMVNDSVKKRKLDRKS